MRRTLIALVAFAALGCATSRRDVMERDAGADAGAGIPAVIAWTLRPEDDSCGGDPGPDGPCFVHLTPREGCPVVTGDPGFRIDVSCPNRGASCGLGAGPRRRHDPDTVLLGGAGNCRFGGPTGCTASYDHLTRVSAADYEQHTGCEPWTNPE